MTTAFVDGGGTKSFVGSAAIPEIEYYRPMSTKQALDMLNKFKESKEKARIIAGGTDLIPAFRRGKISTTGPIVDISSIDELKYVARDDGAIRIGALTQLTDVEKSSIISQHAPALAEAISQLGSLQIRNMATIGGNLCNASPAADTAPPLMVLNADVELRGTGRGRRLSLTDFFLGPGKTALEPDELLTEVRIPISETDGAGSKFIKLGRRNSFTLSVISVATFVKVRNNTFDEVRIALGSVAPTPIRAKKAEESLAGRAATPQTIEDSARIVRTEITPISDVRASAEYRIDMSEVLAKRALSASVQQTRI